MNFLYHFAESQVRDFRKLKNITFLRAEGNPGSPNPTGTETHESIPLTKQIEELLKLYE